MKGLLFALFVCLLALTSLSEVEARSGRSLQRRRFHPKNGRGTRKFKAPSQLASMKRSVNATVEDDCVVTTKENAIKAPKENIWAGLSDVEAAAVTGFLFADKTLNLTRAENATDWDNALALVELLMPNKTDALDYLDFNSSTPGRYAHAVLDMRATEEPYMQDVIVGPLPVKNGTTKIAQLNYPYNKGEGRVRNYNADEDRRTDFLNNVSASIADITMELWGVKATGSENDTAQVFGIDPLWREDNRTISWDEWWGVQESVFDDSTLFPLGLYIKTDITSRNSDEWKILGWLYDDIFYETIENFRAAMNSTSFVRNGPNLDGTWAQTDRDGPIRPFDDQYPPVNVQADGPRYAIDVEEKYVEWMDFSFYISFSRDTGMHLHEICYKGDRIIYEIGLQEALAHYAGNDPVQSGTAYLDSFYGFGPYAFELIGGYDCPTYATYLNSTFYTEETTHTHINSICIFEQDAGYPISRHTNMDYTTATKNIFLTVRSISTVGNYDYMFDYSFYLDGSIGVDVRASGYIQSAYFAKNEDYGFKIHDNLSGSMHDHVLNWKVDFDILGTKNTLSTTELVPVSKTYPWSGGKVHNTMTLKKGFITNEDQGKIDWPANNAIFYSVVNQDEKNKYGEYRGYKISPSTGNLIHVTVKNSTNLNQAAEWAYNHLFVTKQKDTEPRSAHPYNNVDTHNPPVDFSKFFNGENIEQEDIVLWFNLGMHHIPHTGDLPNTVFSTAHSGITIAPQNYLLQSPTKQSLHQVRITYKDGVVSDVEDNGTEAPQCKVDLKRAAETDLWDYKGDVVIRKFPFDPVNWFYETDSIV